MIYDWNEMGLSAARILLDGVDTMLEDVTYLDSCTGEYRQLRKNGDGMIIVDDCGLPVEFLGDLLPEDFPCDNRIEVVFIDKRGTDE